MSPPRVRRHHATGVALSKVMALRFVARLGALGAERRGRLAARLRDRLPTGDDVRARVRAAVSDPAIVGDGVDLAPFVGALDQIAHSVAEEAVADDASDVVRALLVHGSPEYESAFRTLYEPFEPDIGFEMLLLG